MSDFMKSNAQLDDAVNGSDNFEGMREKMKAQLARDGVISRDEASLLYGVSVTGRQSSEPNVSLPANGFRYEKELTFAPESGRRNLMLRANSLEDLAALERQILGY
jgi:hypothetical protein